MSGEQRVWENATVDDEGNVVVGGTMTWKKPDGTTVFAVGPTGPDPTLYGPTGPTGPTGPAGADGVTQLLATVPGINLTALGAHTLYTPTVGKTCIITDILLLTTTGGVPDTTKAVLSVGNGTVADIWNAECPALEFIEDIPSPATQGYVTSLAKTYLTYALTLIGSGYAFTQTTFTSAGPVTLTVATAAVMSSGGFTVTAYVLGFEV